MDQRKTDLLEAQLLVEQLEQREQMLEAQIEMLQVQKILLRPRTSLQNILRYSTYYLTSIMLNLCICVFIVGERQPSTEDHGDGRDN
jgi:hypothetical protein